MRPSTKFKNWLMTAWQISESLLSQHSMYKWTPTSTTTPKTTLIIRIFVLGPKPSTALQNVLVRVKREFFAESAFLIPSGRRISDECGNPKPNLRTLRFQKGNMTYWYQNMRFDAQLTFQIVSPMYEQRRVQEVNKNASGRISPSLLPHHASMPKFTIRY